MEMQKPISFIDLPKDATVAIRGNVYFRPEVIAAHFPDVNATTIDELCEIKDDQKVIDLKDNFILMKLWPDRNLNDLYNEVLGHPRFTTVRDNSPGIMLVQGGNNLSQPFTHLFAVVFRDNDDLTDILYRRRHELIRVSRRYFHHESFSDALSRLDTAREYMSSNQHHFDQVRIAPFMDEEQVFIITQPANLSARDVMHFIEDAFGHYDRLKTIDNLRVIVEQYHYSS